MITFERILYNITGIKLKINGSANVEWSEKTNDGYRTYSNSEQYFVYKKTLFGHQGGIVKYTNCK